jgi:hypothetical protein
MRNTFSGSSTTNPTTASSMSAQHKSSLFASQRRQAAVSAVSQAANGKDVEEELQRENDAILEALNSDMARLKAAAHTLRDETAEHNKLLDTVATVFANAKDGVKGTVTKLDATMARFGCKHTFMCAGIGFLVLLVVFWLLRTLWHNRGKQE